MKVSFPKNWKTTFTVAELEEAKKLQAQFRDGGEDVADLAKTAAATIAQFHYVPNSVHTNVPSASAEFIVSAEKVNTLSDEFPRLDVLINFTAEIEYEVVIIGSVFLSDIYALSSQLFSTQQDLYRDAIVKVYKYSL